VGCQHIWLIFRTVWVEVVMPTVVHVLLMQNLYKRLSCQIFSYL